MPVALERGSDDVASGVLRVLRRPPRIGVRGVSSGAQSSEFGKSTRVTGSAMTHVARVLSAVMKAVDPRIVNRACRREKRYRLREREHRHPGDMLEDDMQPRQGKQTKTLEQPRVK